MAGSVRKTSTKKRTTSRRKASTRKNGKFTWVGFVKHYQKEHGIESYGEAMSKAKGPWKSYKKAHGIE